ncbi:hypothetical protein T11_18485 [Trichinella zimbabwensis]|uniref:Uncharacterized protein n=1 Tax=Trichinella zimbabwensis TaxID=268475 RepID=A0A0V1H2W0_9BILA|nr:hypothetical protein T11_18485 [Trichinella zimbabwensis]
MIAIESADCLWSHYERFFKLLYFFIFSFFLVFWNVQAADTVVLLMSMLIHCNVWSLLSRHPARSSFYEGLSQQSQSIFFITIMIYQMLKKNKYHCINYFSEDFDFHHSSHCSVLFICTQQIFVHALNYLAIPDIKNSKVQAADAVVFLMSMTIYARSSFNEGLSQQSQSVYTAATVKVGTKSYLYTNYLAIPDIKNSKVQAADAVVFLMSMTIYVYTATVKVGTKSCHQQSLQSCILRGCSYEVTENHFRV